MEKRNVTSPQNIRCHANSNHSEDVEESVRRDITRVSSPQKIFLDAAHDDCKSCSVTSDQESDCSGSDYITSKQKQRRPTAPVTRRFSLHRDMLLNRRINRVGSEKRKIPDRKNSVKAPNLFSSLDCGHLSLKPKKLHLGHSAPNISYFFMNEKNSSRKTSCSKSGSSSFSVCQAPSNKCKSYLIKGSPKNTHIKSRRISMNSLLSSDWSSFPSPSSAFSSRQSSQEVVDPTSEFDSLWDEERGTSPSSPFRPRAQSFNLRLQEPDSRLNALNEFYRHCFPKAIAEMELKLEKFIGKCKLPDFCLAMKSDGSASFILHQLVELAGDCLEKSRTQQISSAYFSELVCSMQQLIENVRSNIVFHSNDLALMVRELLLITSRPARLLECLEFDPNDFYKKLEQKDMKQIHNADVITYILKKLCLDKSSDKEATNDNDSSDTSSNNSTKEVPSKTSKDLSLSSAEDSKDQDIAAFQSPPQETDFETVKLISNGAYGAVLLVRHKESKKLFAMKKLLKSDLVLRNMIDQVFAERDILTFINNPFVVSFYCSFETRRHLCMVLEYVEGGDCGALLKNIGGPLPLDMSRLYFAETILALEYLHSFGVVHRDLKPDNLLLTSTGHIKLTDFGLSRIGLMKMTTNLFEGSNRDCSQFLDNQLFGTPEYIAPEVILGQGYGQTVDWWSMGVILYQFLVGCVPFTGETTEEVFGEIVSGEILWPEEEEFQVCHEARDIIESLLERDPVNRLGYAGALEVKDHLFFEDVDWSGLLRQKTQFVPQLIDEEDTSYFDMRSERYCHRLDDSGGEEEKNDLFKSFSTCSPRYSKTEIMIFNDKYHEADAKDKPPQIEVDHDWSDSHQSVTIGSFPPQPVNESLRSSNNTLPSRNDNKSCSSLFETCLQMEKDQNIKKGTGLRHTASLKRYREDRINKSSLSPSLGNSTPIRNKVPHRLVRQFSRDSSGSSFDDSFQENLPKVIQVIKGREGFGFNFRALKVLSEVTGKYSLQHVIVHVEKNGSAHKAGLCVGDVLTHVDNNRISAWPHRQVIKLLLRQQSPTLVKKSNPLTRISNNSNIETIRISEESSQNPIADGFSSLKDSAKPRTVQKSKSLKLRMMNVLRKYSKLEEKSNWYTSDNLKEEDINSSQSDDKEEDSGKSDCSLTPQSHSIELKVMPTVKVKKAIKPTKKISALFSKKKTVDILMMPKSFFSFQEKSLIRRNKYYPASYSDGSPVKKGCESPIWASSSLHHPTQLRHGRPSSLVWGSRRESMTGSVLSPLVLCPSSNRSSVDSYKSTQNSPCSGSTLVHSNPLSGSPDWWNASQVDNQPGYDESRPQFFLMGSDSGMFENSEPPTPSQALK